jgi:hypothetical protein
MPREVFQSARRRAFIQDILAELSGRSADLLSFEEVNRHLRPTSPIRLGETQDIPLDKIVGSVGRYREFTRAFLPRALVSEDRWRRIERLEGRTDLPAISVFKVGDVYFVQDGNHRVSVARAHGRQTIRAHVVEVPVRVPLGPDTSPGDLILKSGYAEFLEKTALDRRCPGQSIELTKPGAYRSLLKHIEVHQFYMGLRSRAFPTLEDATEDWYNEVYRPVVDRIRASGILKRFPGRTESDLYLWISENRARLQMRYVSQEQAQEAVDAFAQRQRRGSIVHRAYQWLRTLVSG